jgi:hypothetical protein
MKAERRVRRSPDSGKALRLYVGADAQNVQRRRLNLTGLRCFSSAYGPKSRFTAEEVPHVVGLLDSGAFSDSPERRLTPEGALERQLHWEREAERFWGAPWQAEAMVSYDTLIDEKWCGKARHKERWTVAEADHAVRVTVDAAAYLSRQRERLSPRRLVLACQGVDAGQYSEAMAGVLAHAQPGDWIGLGGWCILGWFRSWIPVFWATAHQVIPMIAGAGTGHVHIFGVLYRPVLGGLLWLCDQHRLSLSTDSSGPVLQPSWPNHRKAGALASTWEANVIEWQQRLAVLRESEYYREPPAGISHRQRTFAWED